MAERPPKPPASTKPSKRKPAAFHVAWSLARGGCWQLRRAGAKRATRLDANFYELVRVAKRRAETLGAVVYLHTQGGRILSRLDYSAGGEDA